MEAQDLDEDEEIVEPEKITVSVHPALMRRAQELIRSPELDFRGLEDFIRSALYSFVYFKEKQLARIRGEGRSR